MSSPGWFKCIGCGQKTPPGMKYHKSRGALKIYACRSCVNHYTIDELLEKRDMKSKLFCIKDPDGKFMPYTLGYGRNYCIDEARGHLTRDREPEWEVLYRKGYRAVPVTIEMASNDHAPTDDLPSDD